MRKLTALLLSAILLLGLVGCGTQPAGTTVPSASETETENVSETAKETSAAETDTTTVTAEEAASSEETNAEESTEAVSSGESAGSTTAEESAETTAAEIASDSTADETPEETGTEQIFADAFRFTVPADWTLQADGSYFSGSEKVCISFRTIPLDHAPMAAGIKVSDEAFAGQLAEYMSANDGESSYSVHSEQLIHTAKELDNRFILLRREEGSGTAAYLILSVYDLSEEECFAVRFDFGPESGIEAEQCWETVNSTIERAD